MSSRPRKRDEGSCGVEPAGRRCSRVRLPSMLVGGAELVDLDPDSRNLGSVNCAHATKLENALAMKRVTGPSKRGLKRRNSDGRRSVEAKPCSLSDSPGPTCQYPLLHPKTAPSSRRILPTNAASRPSRPAPIRPTRSRSNWLARTTARRRATHRASDSCSRMARPRPKSRC